MKSVTIQNENIDLAKQEAIAKLRVNPRYLSFDIEDDSLTATVNIELEDLIYEYLSSFFDAAGITYTIDINKENTSITFNIDTNDNPLLIGRDGKVLEALQFIVRQIAYQYSDKYDNVSVDVGGYKRNRNKHLESLAVKTAKEVAKTGISAELKGLNSYERRIVHAKLADWTDVETASHGEGQSRYLVISAKK